MSFATTFITLAMLSMIPRLVPIDQLYRGKPNDRPDCFTRHGIRTNRNLTHKIMRSYHRQRAYLGRAQG